MVTAQAVEEDVSPYTGNTLARILPDVAVRGSSVQQKRNHTTTSVVPTVRGETVWNVAVVVAKQLNLEPGSSVETINVEGAKRISIAPFDEGGNRKWKLSLLAGALGITHGWTFVLPT